jgi:hypothetical protein
MSKTVKNRLREFAATFINSIAPRSRVSVGLHRVGVVLAAPLLAGAAIAAVLQWQSPTGPLVMTPPVGTRGYGFADDELDDAARQIIEQQKQSGYKLSGSGFDDPPNLMIVGFPLGAIHYNNADWTKFQLPDGREIGIASTDSGKVSDAARQFLLTEKRGGRSFTDKDRISFNGLPVAFLNPFDQFPPATPPWLHKERNWTWTLLALSAGLMIYLVMRAIGWIVNGFARGREA